MIQHCYNNVITHEAVLSYNVVWLWIGNVFSRRLSTTALKASTPWSPQWTRSLQQLLQNVAKFFVYRKLRLPGYCCQNLVLGQAVARELHLHILVYMTSGSLLSDRKWWYFLIPSYEQVNGTVFCLHQLSNITLRGVASNLCNGLQVPHLHSSEHQSGVNFECPTSKVIWVCSPVITLHARYCIICVQLLALYM